MISGVLGSSSRAPPRGVQCAARSRVGRRLVGAFLYLLGPLVGRAQPHGRGSHGHDPAGVREGGRRGRADLFLLHHQRRPGAAGILQRNPKGTHVGCLVALQAQHVKGGPASRYESHWAGELVAPGRRPCHRPRTVILVGVVDITEAPSALVEWVVAPRERLALVVDCDHVPHTNGNWHDASLGQRRCRCARVLARASSEAVLVASTKGQQR